MESKFFTWEEWDELDTMSFLFHSVKFIADFGVFKAGDKFDFIEMNYATGMIRAGHNDGDLDEVNQAFTLAPVSQSQLLSARLEVAPLGAGRWQPSNWVEIAW